MNGKGSNRRPMCISEDEFTQRWQQAFGDETQDQPKAESSANDQKKSQRN